MYLYEVFKLIINHYWAQPEPREFNYQLCRCSWSDEYAVMIDTREKKSFLRGKILKEYEDTSNFIWVDHNKYSFTVIDLFAGDWTVSWAKAQDETFQTLHPKGTVVSEGQSAKDSRSVNVSNYKELFSEIGPNLTKICMAILEEAKRPGMTPSKAKFLASFTENMFAMIKLMG